MTDWLRRIETMGEATGPIPSENLVKPPSPTSTPRQSTMRGLFTNPPLEFRYLHDIFGEVRFNLVSQDADALVYLVQVIENDAPNTKFTALAFVLRHRNELQEQLMRQYKLKEPRRIIHTGDWFTSKYMLARPDLDFVLMGFQKHYGIEPHAVI
tara:strand:+ start:340 stop:801 length:462 start_codon:yes stop_codon:yes gene_type:complete